MDFLKISQTPSWLIGSLLGDSHVTKRGVLNIGHSYNQLDYFLLKYNKLKELSVLSPHMQLNYHYSERLDPRSHKIYKKLSVTTLAHFLH